MIPSSGSIVAPDWVETRSQPIAIQDVVAALTHVLEGEEAGVYDLPGPEVLSVSEMLVRVAEMVGNRPRLVSVRNLDAWLSSQWIALLTRADR